MMRLLDFASKLSGSLALVCAILAVLSTASSARADDLGCDNCCAQTYTWGSIEWNECVSQCRQGAGPCAAASGPGGPGCPWSPDRPCDNMCSQSPNCLGDNLCKSNGTCTNCVCRTYQWPQGSNCECRPPA